ncbi:type II toxin-antitoxin system RelE/ParE family toxin [Aquimarina agarilytica]|uniref:type II toxin-antitoxin system RelE/ParE family toxin n=1 Tax=Aquimarina agarilytica TaxID=1087449 RepID=UPI00028A10FA|nr:hypothetical protein [Aquimarina agarilytica]
MNIRVDWSDDSVEDLNFIFERVKKKTVSKELAKNVIDDIYETGISISFVEQYQVDEILGKPYRRMVVRHFKLIYRAMTEKHIRIIQVFDTYQNSLKLRKDI